MGNPHDDPADTIPASFNRFCNHFYDPVHNTKLNAGGCGGSDLTSAPIWALGVQELAAGDPGKLVAPMPMSSPNPNRRNHYSILDAREAMWRALTLKQFKDQNGSLLIDGNGALLGLPPPLDPNRAFSSATALEANAQYRDAYWATTFRALGDVLHLNQDMAQPQHTRIEEHPLWEAKYYERYTDARARTDTGITTLRKFDFPTASWTVVNVEPLNFAAPFSPPAFANYSDYWSTQPGGNVVMGRGLADYSNTRFFTYAHNLGQDYYDLPSNNASDSGYTPRVVPDQSGRLTTYLEHEVPEPLGGTGPTIRLTKQTIWPGALIAAGVPAPSGTPRYTLDEKIFDGYADLLIPRAVAYSAGLLNYFFRGQMEIRLPDAGVYGLVDHSLFAPGGPNYPGDPVGGFKGFDKIKLKLLNTTPNIVPPGGPTTTQIMPSGTIVAVVKFYRDTCYTDDLAMEPIDATSAANCRSASEEIVVSEPALDKDGVNAVTSVPADVPVELVFKFSAQQIPINARDVYLQVVYRGQLGTENDAVVVATKDISEPTYFSHYNAFDLTWNGTDFDVDPAPGPDAFTLFRFTVGADQAPVTLWPPVTFVWLGAEFREMYAPHFARVATLQELGQPLTLQLHPIVGDCDLPSTYDIDPYVAKGSSTDLFNTRRGIKSWYSIVCYSSDQPETSPTKPFPPLPASAKYPIPLDISGW